MPYYVQERSGSPVRQVYTASRSYSPVRVVSSGVTYGYKTRPAVQTKQSVVVKDDKNSCQRLCGNPWKASVIVLSILCVVFAIPFIILLLQNVGKEDQNYDVYLRTPVEQVQFEALYLQSKYRVTLITAQVRSDAPCLVGCYQSVVSSAAQATCPIGDLTGSVGGKVSRKRRSESRRYTRGAGGEGGPVGGTDIGSTCCPSQPVFASPEVLVNVHGDQKKIYHQAERRQYIVEEECRHVDGCQDCKCYQEEETIPLVVEFDNKLSIDYFAVRSCCKCFF